MFIKTKLLNLILASLTIVAIVLTLLSVNRTSDAVLNSNQNKLHSITNHEEIATYFSYLTPNHKYHTCPGTTIFKREAFSYKLKTNSIDLYCFH